MAPRLELFPFRYRDPRTGKLVHARYGAEREEIAAREALLDAELRRYSERPPELQPAIDAAEAFLLAVFLRRYITYCARRRRFAAMNGAARLYANSRVRTVETNSPVEAD